VWSWSPCGRLPLVKMDRALRRIAPSQSSQAGEIERLETPLCHSAMRSSMREHCLAMLYPPFDSSAERHCLLIRFKIPLLLIHTVSSHSRYGREDHQREMEETGSGKQRITMVWLLYLCRSTAAAKALSGHATETMHDCAVYATNSPTTGTINDLFLD
jgi:hypothetical protein